MIMLMILSKASVCLGVLGWRESMTPVGGYDLRVFMETHQIAALSTFFNNKKYHGTTLILGRTQSPNVRTKSTSFLLSVKTCVTFSDAGSVSGQLIDSDHRAVKATLKSLVPPKKKKPLKKDRQRLLMR